jgi:hypothetical protein
LPTLRAAQGHPVHEMRAKCHDEPERHDGAQDQEHRVAPGFADAIRVAARKHVLASSGWK